MPVEPFAFSEESRNAPTAFEIFFRTKTAEYRYILHIWQEQVVYESLDKVKLESGRRSALFVRKGEEIQLKGAFGKFKISEDLSQTLPLLSYLGITYMKNANNHRTEYIRFLNEKFAELKIGKYQKNMKNIF